MGPGGSLGNQAVQSPPLAPRPRRDLLEAGPLTAPAVRVRGTKAQRGERAQQGCPPDTPCPPRPAHSAPASPPAVAGQVLRQHAHGLQLGGRGGLDLIQHHTVLPLWAGHGRCQPRPTSRCSFCVPDPRNIQGLLGASIALVKPQYLLLPGTPLGPREPPQHPPLATLPAAPAADPGRSLYSPRW